MNGEILTTIITSLMAAIAGPIGAWVGRKLERAKYRIELDKFRSEVKAQELDNVRRAANILMESIVPPLQIEIENLRNDLQRLNNVLERIWGCPHIDLCPVRYELLFQPKGYKPGKDAIGADNRENSSGGTPDNPEPEEGALSEESY